METLEKIWKKLTKNLIVEKAKTIEKVAVFGFADAAPESKLYKDAYRVCKVLAEAGYTVVDGGGPGVMLAASKGAKAGHGKVIGVTLNPQDLTHFEGRNDENIVDEEIKTTTYIERTLTLMQQGQVYVIFNGGTGTISEFAMAWGLARLYFGHHKPLILYGNFWRKVMKAMSEGFLLRPEEREVYKIADNPTEVLKAIKEFECEIESDRIKECKISGEDGYSFS
ncbi:MAG: LOG family protein [Candidatus Daviesbacteria bacterium]|nr:LOG family protein [Candidatus Daviesbacteria bacterium]